MKNGLVLRPHKPKTSPFSMQVEMRGVEPLSENPSNEPSPSAVRGLFSFCRRPRTNFCKSSFIITDTGAKLNRYSFPAILTPVTGSAGGQGRRAALSRESVIAIVSYCFSPLIRSTGSAARLSFPRCSRRNRIIPLFELTNASLLLFAKGTPDFPVGVTFCDAVSFVVQLLAFTQSQLNFNASFP